jgi:hypothetical protein
LHQLVRTEGTLIRRTLRRHGVPEALADDAKQSVFITLANRIDDVAAGRERAFLLAVCLRVAANVRRAEARRREVLSDSIDQFTTASDPEGLLQQKERRSVLNALLEALPSMVDKKPQWSPLRDDKRIRLRESTALMRPADGEQLLVGKVARPKVRRDAPVAHLRSSDRWVWRARPSC